MNRPVAQGHRNLRSRAGQPLLEDKLQIPQPSFPVLARRRVTRALEEAVRHKVTLISAPAGAGKTVACASWAAARPAGRVVWLTLDASDRRDWFWGYIHAGLSRARPVTADVRRALEESSPADFPFCLVEAAQAFTVPLVLVLDDIHEVSDPAVLHDLDVLIRHAPLTLRVVLSGRWPPALQLARLRVSGELADIGGAELACTAREADAYFSMLGMEVSPSQRDAVLTRTQGWMAGLRLAALRAGAGHQQGASLTSLAGDEPIVTDYLWDEVLARQGPDTHDLLVRTSIVPEVSGELAAVLAGQPDAVRTLDRLSRENSFVETLDRGHGEYRYHPLLREVLTAELHRDIPHEIPALLRRAADWYTGRGRTLDALRCAARAQDWDYAAQVLAASGVAAVMSAGPEELESVLSLLPADLASHDAAVAAAWAAARLWSGDSDGVTSYLDAAGQALARMAPGARRVVEPMVAALRIMHACSRDDTDPALAGQGRLLADSGQSHASTPAEHTALGLLWFALGVSGMRRWEMGQARDALRHADRQLAAGGLAGLRAPARAWRALAEACCGDLSAALQAADGVRKGRIPVTQEASCLVTLAYAQVSLARDDLAGAQRLLEEVDRCRAGCLPGEPPLTTVAALMRARILFADGDAAAARAVLSRLRDGSTGQVALSGAMRALEADAALRAGDTGRARALLLLVDDGDVSSNEVTLIQAGLQLAEGDLPGALGTVDPFLATDSVATIQERIRALMVAAVAHRRLGAVREAADRVEQALGLAEPEGASRVFLDCGATVRSAVTVLVPPTSRHAGFAGRVLERFDAQGPRLPGRVSPDSAHLTDSERAVLCFLPSHMTNEEISQALFLSVNTVKTHLRSAYRKLGVGSRREAIARSRRMGLLLSRWPLVIPVGVDVPAGRRSCPPTSGGGPAPASFMIVSG